MQNMIEELPIKKMTTKHFKKMSLTGHQIMLELGKLNAEFSGFDWGTQVNNPCEIYKTPEGKVIEVYGCEQCGIPTSAFVEV